MIKMSETGSSGSHEIYPAESSLTIILMYIELSARIMSHAISTDDINCTIDIIERLNAHTRL